MKTERNGDGKLLGIVFRIFAFVFAASGLFMLQGLSEGLEPWVRSFMASTQLPDELRFHAASHGALIGILFSGSLLALLRKPQDSPLLLRFYFFGHLIFLATLTVTDPSVAKSSFLFLSCSASYWVFFMRYTLSAARYSVLPRRPFAIGLCWR